MKNERGAALILVLFLVAIVGLLSTPLIMSTLQGANNTVKGETKEQAYYIAETGALVANRIMLEAVGRAVDPINLGPNNVARMVEDLNAQGNFLYNNTNKPVWTIPIVGARDCSDTFAINSAGTSNRAHITSTQNINLTLVCTQAIAQAVTPIPTPTPTPTPTQSKYTDPATGIFGAEGVSGAITPTPSYYGAPVGYSEDKLGSQDGTSVTRIKTITAQQFATQFNEYFDAQMVIRPLPREPLTPLIPFPLTLSGNTLTVNYRQPVVYDSTLNIVPASYTLTPGTKTISSSQSSALHTGNITISGSNQTVTITGDIVSGNDIILDCNNCIINVTGNMVAKNEIRMTNWNETIQISGNMVSGGQMSFNTVALLSVGRSLSTQKNIDFTNTLNQLNVKDSVIVGTPVSGNDGIRFSGIDALKIDGYFSSLTAINFSNTLGNIAPPNKVGLSIITGKDFIINSFTRLDVGKNISSLTKVNFANTLDTINVLDGSIISGGDVVFNAVKQLHVAGDISSKLKVNFSNTIEYLKMTGSGSILSGSETVFNAIKDISMTGSISTPGNVNFSNTIEKMAMTGSIYTGGTLTFNAITSMDTGNIYATALVTNNTISDMDIKGSILTKGSLNFKSIGNMTVSDFMGAIGSITFSSGLGTSPKPLFGGITTGGNINFADWAKNDKNAWINLEYHPPANATAGGGTLPTPTPLPVPDPVIPSRPTISVDAWTVSRK
ncbi:hypothetical protein [Paenibacillus agricola]|nr:hypothetical protein [Paenibacillus agricola]